ncbi:MAG: hypothetical protein FD166_2641 [Bacteroidetes bacterium]|nr:MAG: hypothetical protein FD166_2641 [Bacteroidota bacterium]
MIDFIKRFVLNQNSLIRLIAFFYFLCLVISFRYIIRGKKNSISIKKDVIFKNCCIKVIGNNNRIVVGAKSRFRNLFIQISGSNNTLFLSNSIVFYEGGRIEMIGDNSIIEVGERCTFGSTDIFTGEGSTSINIGANCMFSRNIGMNTSDFHSIIDLNTNYRINLPKDILIGNHVWVGNSVFISKGAVIGNNSVIAQKALVPGKFFENNSLIAGLPAKTIKSNVSWTRQKL